MKSNWTPRWWARIHATLVWRRFRDLALLRARCRSARDRRRRSGLARLDGLARLEPRTLLAADIATDRFDYAPGSTALFTTFSDGGPDHNFQVGETIQFQVVRTDGLADNAPGNLPWKVTDGVGGFAAYVDETGVRIAPDRDGLADGRIETEWFVGSEYANASLEVRATGLVSGAVATEAFHDSAIVITANTAWSQITTGSGVNGAPTANDSIVVNQGATLTIDVNGAVAGAVTLGNGATGTAALAFSAGTIGATFGSLANNGTSTLAFNNAASTLTVGTANTSTTFAGTISGAGSLTKVGTGGLTLIAANTYSGGTRITGGFVAIGQNNGGVGGDSISPNGTSTSLGAGTIDIAAGASLHLNTAGLNIANAIILNGMSYGQNSGGPQATNGGPWNGAIMGASLGGVVSSTISGTITLNATSNITTNWTDKTLIITGRVTGPGGLVIDNSAPRNRRGSVVELRNSANDYLGDTTVQGGNSSGSGANPTLRQGAANAIPSGPGKGNLVVNGQLDGGGYALLVKGLTGSGAIRNVLTLQIGNSDANGSFSGIISGNCALTKVGAGTLTLSGANTYTGGTTITGGVLVLGSAGAIGTSGTISFGGGTLQYSASNTTDYSARFSTAANQTYSIDSNGQNVTFAGALASSGGSLRKTGAGRLTLTGSNTYTGGTIVSGGTLKIGANNVLADSGAVILSGGTLDLGASSDTIGSLSGPGTVTTTTGVLTVAGRLAGSVATGNIGLANQATFAPSVDLLAGGTSSVAGLTVAGTVDLGGSSLELTISGRADVGQTVKLVDNDGSDPVVGSFTGLPAGTVFLAGNGQTFRIDYAGGDGNDIVLTRVLVDLTVGGITVASRPYDGGTIAPLNLVGATLAGLVPGDPSTTLVTAGVSGSYGDPNAGFGKPVAVTGLSLTGALADNYFILPPDVTGTIDRAQTSIQGPASVIYSGYWQRGVVVGYGIGGETLGTAFTNETVTDAGVYAVTWLFVSQDPNYADASGDGTLTVRQAAPTVNVFPYVTIYDGQPHSATGTATGVNGEDLSSGLQLEGTTHAAPGTYADQWSFISPNANYEDFDPGVTLVNTILPRMYDAPSVALANDTGTNASDGTTSDGALSVTGVEVGNGIEYSIDAGQTWSEAFRAVEGGNVVLVRQFDGLGGMSPETRFEFTLDTHRPVAPATRLANDTGSSPVDRVTSDATLTHEAMLSTLFNTGVDASGKLAANWATELHYTLVSTPGGTDIVRVAAVDNGWPIGPWVSDIGSSSWIGPASDDVLSGPGGEYVYRTTFDLSGVDPATVSISGGWATDDIGIEILVNGTSQGSVSWVSPGYWSFEAFLITGGFVEGINTLDFVLSNGGGPTGLRVEMTGTGSTVELGSIIEYSTDHGTTWSPQWTAVEGLNQLLLRQIDPAGNISDPTAFDFTLDTQFPQAPVVALVNDTGANTGDGITADGRLSVTGIENGARDEYSIDGVTWSGTFAAIEGQNSVLVRQIDLAGNASEPTSFEFTLDTSGPVVRRFQDHFGTTTPGGIRAGDTLDFSACTVPLTFTAHPDGSLVVEEASSPVENRLVFTAYGDVVGGKAANRFVFLSSAAFAGKVVGTTTATNTLDYAASTLGVTVDLGAATASGTGGVAAITAIVGSTLNGAVGGNTLVGPGRGQVWTIGIPGSGVVGGVAFSRIDTIVAASAGDTLDYALSAVAVNVDLALGLASGFERIIGFRNVIGSAFADTLVGDANDNTIAGLAGDDALSGGGGTDAFDGGAGTDAVIESGDIDFTLAAGLLTGLGTETLLGIESARLTGGDAANTFTLDGWVGDALLSGGAGNDRYVYRGTEAARVTVVEAANADVDTLDFSGLGNGGVSLDLGVATAQTLVAGLTLTLSSATGLENVAGTAFADAVVGNARDNVLAGLAGDDTLVGLAGDDTLDGGAGTDAVNESADGDFTLTAASLVGIGSDGLAGIEAVKLAAGGGANTFTIDGWTGSVVVAGGAGNDVYLFRGTAAANVTIVEGANADTDRLDFSRLLNGGVILDLAVTTAQTLVPGLTLRLSTGTAIEDVIGTAYADTVLGNARDNKITGLAGADTLFGRSGDDMFSGDLGDDSFDGGVGVDAVFEAADVDFTLGSSALGGLGNDALAGIEAVNLKAGDGANTFTLNGWAGAAVLTGNAGNDTYVFTGTASASVTIVEAADTDTDSLDFANLANGAVNLDLAVTTTQAVVSGLVLTLSSTTGLENVTGTPLADTLVGNARDNVVSGLAGNDTLSGLAGNDTFSGGIGSDTVAESADVDFILSASTLTGVGIDALAGIETLSLTAGADATTFTLDGWAGNALLTGGRGSDVYVFVGTAAANVTIVEAADADADTLDFSALLNGAVSVDLGVTTARTVATGLTLAVSSATGLENVIGTAFADTLVGNARDNVLSGMGGNDTLTGLMGNDTFAGGAGSDTVTESGNGDFTLAAAALVGAGSDTLSGIETVNLAGGSGTNTFTVEGWTGSAILAGGAGNDRYVFTGTESAGVTIIEIGNADSDTLDFTNLANGGVSLDLSLTTTQTVVSGLSMTLSAALGIENVTGTGFADTLQGNARGNILLGLGGDDTLTGRAGDDTFDGGGGADIVTESANVDFTLTGVGLSGRGSDTLTGIETVSLTAGGSGNTFTVDGWTGNVNLTGNGGGDTYVFTGTESAIVTIVEAADTDADTLDFTNLANGGVSLDLSLTTPQTLVAGLTLTLSSATGLENVTGTPLADTLVGNERGNILLGLGGDDTLTGSAGDDAFDGGAGVDTVVESADVDFALAVTSLGGVGSDTLAGIEGATLTAGTSANTFTVQSWAGSATLAGGSGNDTYVFTGTESANVTIVEVADADTDGIDFTNLANGGVSLDLATTTSQTVVAGLTLTLSSATGLESATGTSFADTLLGNARSNTLAGLSGDDTLTGRAGSDSFDGGAGADTVVESADVDFTLAAASLSGVGSDTLTGIEGASLTAGTSANTFTVQSWTGSAILAGGSGNDAYVFTGTASASVTIVEGADTDTDTLDFTNLANGGVSLDLTVATSQALVAGLTLTLSSDTGIENVVGTAFADSLQGNARGNTLSGLAGNDALSGRGGDDTFTGGAGNDAFDGGAGTDAVVESADVNFTLAAATLSGVGSDTLAGIEGASLTAGVGANTFTVDGWTGNAVLAGGTGDDTYVFTGTESASVTIVEAADTDADTLDFTNLANGGVTIDLAATTPQTLVAGLTLTLSSATGLENVTGTALADTLQGNARANTISGLAGDDTLAGRGGDDRYVFAGTLSANVTVVESADADADTLDFAGLSNGGLILDLGSTAPQSIASGLTLTLSTATGLENVTATESADTLLGNTRDNVLSGLGGDDDLDGAAGTDTVVADGNVDYTLTPTTLTGVGSDTLAGIEAASLTAGAGANTFTVNAWTGSATLTGGAGNDRYVFVGAVSASIAIVETADADTDGFDFSGLSLSADTGTTIDLALTTPQAVTSTLTIALSDAAGIEDVTGTAAADTMLGNARDNAFAGLGGDDTLAGRAGSNTLDGGAGTDTVIESGNVDATVTAATITGVGSSGLLSVEVVDLVGGSGANTFTVNGWGGSLILEGGLGNDAYVFVGGTSTHVRVVESAGADSDTLDFSAVTLTGGAGLVVDLAVTTEQDVAGGLFVTLSDSQGIENVVGTDAADTMAGNSRDNVFRGLWGQDTIDGRDGTDTFVKAFGLVNVIVTDASLTGCGTDSFQNIEVVNVTLGPDPTDCGEVGLDGRVLDASGFNGTLIADFGTDSLEITRSSSPSGLATSTLVIPALLEGLSVISGTVYLESEINTGAAGSVTLDSSGAIIDDNDPETKGTELEVPPPVNNVVASRLVLRSVGGIVGGVGMDDVLDTQVSVISAKNSGSGDISILNQKNVHGPVDVVDLVNSAGSVAVENYGDETHGITVSGAVRAKGIVSLISHSPLTIDGSIQSTSDSEITLEADTLTMTKTSKIVTTGDVAMNSRIVSLTDADMADAKIKNSRSDAQIDVSGGSFNTLTSTGKGSQIDVRGGAFKTLTASSAGSIDVRGGSFTVLNTSNVGKIDVSGGSFKTLSASGAGKIDVAGGSFEELTTDGSGALGISDGSFKTVTVSGSSGIDVRGGKFGVLTTSSSGSIDVRGGSFTVMKTSGAGNIDVRGGKFTVLNTSGAGKIDVSGGDFEELIASGTGALGISDGSFKTVTVSGSGGIDVRGGKFSIGLGSSGAGKIDVSGGDFEQLVASGDGALGITDGSFKTVTVSGSGGIDVRGGKFSIGLGSSGAGKIDVSGGDFDQLVASGTGALGITDGSFKTVTVSGSGGIDVRGGKFEVLSSSGAGAIDVRGGKFSIGLGSSGAAKIDVSGGDFDLLQASGTGALGITDGSFKTVSVSGTGAIDVRGGKFEVLSSSGAGAIDVRGGKFSVGMGSSGSAKIDVSGGDFDLLLASGTGALGISDGSFKTVTVTGTGGIDVRGGKFGVLTSSGAGAIDVRGGKFSVGLGSSGAAKIDVSGGDFDQLVASGTGALGISDGSFKTVTVTGGGAIDVRGGKFSVLSSSGAGKIDIAGGSFNIVNSSGAGKIDVAGGSFNTLNASGSGGIDIRGGAFKVGVNSTGSGNKIDVAGADMVSLRNTGAGSAIAISGTRFESITNEADNVSLAVVGDAGSNALINSGNDVTISFTAGDGDDVFVNDGRGDADHGARVALTVDLGAGRDRAVLGGTSLTGSVAGGSGDDTVLFVGGVTGTLSLDEAADLDTDALDFSSLTVVGGVGVTVDLALTTVQAATAGLSLTLSSGVGFEDAVGSSGADVLRGNARDNALFGSDLPDDRLGTAATSNGRVQNVYLDFDSETDVTVGDHAYTTAERTAIATRLAAIYSAFHVQFALDVPALGEYATIKFNKPRPESEDSGGWASEIDFGNRNYGGIATVDVNGLLGIAGGPETTSENIVASSAWVGAHELAHLMGMRHADSFGPPGFGIEAPPGSDGYLIDPAYSGPSAAWETDRHIIETPALTGFTLWDLVAPQFFGERESIKLVYNQTAPMTPDGNLLVAERPTSHDSRSLSGAQELVPVPLSLPNMLSHGLNAGKDLMAGAVAVLGELTATGELDLYRITGRRGDLLNLQVMSAALDRYKHASSSLDLDAVLTVYDAAGTVVALSDDEFETHDPSIIDLVLPADGTYYIEVKGFYHADGEAADTGSYELFLSRFDAASRDDAGDTLEGRGGNDTLSGGRGNDTYVFQGTGLGSDRILEDARFEKSGIGAVGSPDGRDSGDALDFSGFGRAATIDLASTAVQVVAAGDLSLQLSSAADLADEPSAAQGLERVLGSAQGNTLTGNARANTFVGGGSVNAFVGDAADDAFQLGGGANTVDGGAGFDEVTLPGSAADYAITISGSTATVTSLTGVVPASESLLTGVEVVRFSGDGTATYLMGLGDALAGIQAAVDAAAPGDTILVAPGTYSGAIDLDKDDLTLVSSDGSGMTILLGGGASATVTVSATGATVRGFTIDNASVADGSAILLRSAADVTVEGNLLRQAVHGVAHVDDGGSAGASITGNTFAGTVQVGVAGTAHVALTALSGNTFQTSVAAIELGTDVSLVGNVLDRAGIFAMIDAQTLSLSGGAAVVDARTATTYRVAAPTVDEHQLAVVTVPATGLTGAATFSLVAGVDAGLFQIDRATGALTFASLPRFTAPADVGADHVAEVVVSATDGTSDVVTRYLVSVVDVNVAPEFAVATRAIGIAENISVAGVEVATDWDLDALTYSIAGDSADNADGALFTIDPVTGVLSFRAAPDFENLSDADHDGTFQVRVAAVDGGGLVAWQVISVVVADANDNAPVFTSAASATVVENTAIGTVLYTATRTDADATAAFRLVSYSIKAGVGDAAKVAVDAATGGVTLLAAADYETKASYLFVVVADDGVNRAERIVSLNVLDTNDNAPVITSAATGSVTENAATSTVIYTAVRTDADVTAAFRQVTWSIKPAVGDAARVAINATTGAVTLLAAADYETKPSYGFTIVANDGVNAAEKAVTISVADINDNAPVITSGASGSVTENAATTTVIYTGTRTDADVTAAFRSVTWSIKPAVGDAAKVAINPTTGAVTLLATADSETKPSYGFTVVADDGLFRAEQGVTVSVVDVNDNAPVFKSATTGTVVENSATSTVIYTAVRTDADVTAAFRQVTYSIKPLVGDAARVAINPATGAVTLLATADYETKTSYLFTVVADDGVNRSERAVTVSVTDLNDNAPVFTSAASGSVTENAAITTVIYTATRTDADVTAAFRLVTYSIKPLVGDAARVAIHPATGAVTLLASADYETKTSYLFTVVADDGVNRTEKAVTVAVANVDDTAATFTSARTATVVASATLNPPVYTATVNDSADVSQGVAYSLAVADATLFVIDATTGVVTVKGSTLAMKGKTYTFTVTATDKGGAKKAVSQVITLTVA